MIQRTLSQGSGRSFGFKPSRITKCLTQESLPQSLRVSSRRRSLKTLAAYRSLARREWAFIYVQIAAATAKLVMDRDTSCQALVVFANPLFILPSPCPFCPSPCPSRQALVAHAKPSGFLSHKHGLCRSRSTCRPSRPLSAQLDRASQVPLLRERPLIGAAAPKPGSFVHQVPLDGPAPGPLHVPEARSLSVSDPSHTCITNNARKGC